MIGDAEVAAIALSIREMLDPQPVRVMSLSVVDNRGRLDCRVVVEACDARIRDRIRREVSTTMRARLPPAVVTYVDVTVADTGDPFDAPMLSIWLDADLRRLDADRIEAEHGEPEPRCECGSEAKLRRTPGDENTPPGPWQCRRCMRAGPVPTTSGTGPALMHEVAKRLKRGIDADLERHAVDGARAARGFGPLTHAVDEPTWCEWCEADTLTRGDKCATCGRRK